MSQLNKIQDKARNLLIAVGKNNKPTYAVMSVATANGIFKPLSSLTDKKEKPEARRYAALREFMTEVVAVPTYWLCGVSAAKAGEKMFSSDPVKKGMAKTNMMFLGVCTAALFVIPALCSVVLNVLDKFVKKSDKDNSQGGLDVISHAPQVSTYHINDKKLEFGNLSKRPDMAVFINGGGLKI